MTRQQSPAQIRAAASLAWRNHLRRAHADTPTPRRLSGLNETPLSAAEIAFGIERGLIRAGLTDQHPRSA